MEFDIAKFTQTTFQPRTADVPVADLAPYFTGLGKGEGEKAETPVWTIRGMTGDELARANEAVDRNRSRSAIAQGLLSGKDDDVTDAVRELLGTGATVADDIAKRIEMLVTCSVAPECSHQVAVKLSQAFPIEFYQLTNRITQLTGLGAEPGKPKRSSGGQTSSKRSSSAT